MKLDNDPNRKRASRLILLSVCIGQIIVGLDLRAHNLAVFGLAIYASALFRRFGASTGSPRYRSHLYLGPPA